MDHIGLLFQLRFCYIGILAKMQFLELLVLWIAVRLDHRSDIESLELHTIIKKIRNQPLLNICRECFEALVDFKNVDGISPHRLRNIGFHFSHQDTAEIGRQLLAVEYALSADQFDKQFAGIIYAEGHFATCANGKWKFICRLYILHLAVRSPANCHLLGLVDEIDLAMKCAHTACWNVDQMTQNGDILCFQRVPSWSKQVKCLSVQKENCFL